MTKFSVNILPTLEEFSNKIIYSNTLVGHILLGDTEIGYFVCPVFCQHNVFSFQISMYNVHVM
jgi:hypothetical protein